MQVITSLDDTLTMTNSFAKQIGIGGTLLAFRGIGDSA